MEHILLSPTPGSCVKIKPENGKLGTMVRSVDETDQHGDSVDLHGHLSCWPWHWLKGFDTPTWTAHLSYSQQPWGTLPLSLEQAPLVSIFLLQWDAAKKASTTLWRDSQSARCTESPGEVVRNGSWASPPEEQIFVKVIHAHGTKFKWHKRCGKGNSLYSFIK